MRMLKFAVCDDEPYRVEEISDLISEYMEEKCLTDYRISTFTDGSSLLRNGCDFDLIFLDIQMEQPDGMETARLLRQREEQCLSSFRKLCIHNSVFWFL